MNRSLKVGFVGKRGEGALQCFRVMPETEVAAFCTRHEETVRPIADRYAIPQVYTRFEDLLASDVDIIFIQGQLQADAGLCLPPIIGSEIADLHVERKPGRFGADAGRQRQKVEC